MLIRWNQRIKYKYMVKVFGSQGSDGSGSKNFDQGRVNFLWLGSGRVSHLWFGLEFGKLPLKMLNFSTFFPSDQKNCFGSSRVRAHLYLRVERVLCEISTPTSRNIPWLLCQFSIWLLRFLGWVADTRFGVGFLLIETKLYIIFLWIFYRRLEHNFFVKALPS